MTAQRKNAMGACGGALLAGLLSAAGCTGFASEPGAESVTEPEPMPGPMIEPEIPTPGFGLAHIRRLTRAEYGASLAALLGTDPSIGNELLTDGAIHGFTTNIEAPTGRLDVEKYMDLSERLVSEIDIDALLDCRGTEETACIDTFIEEFGARVFRRPLSMDELERYRSLYRELRSARDDDRSARLVVTALLQSPNFVYHIFQGEPTDVPGVHRLTGNEIAERVSYFLFGSPPDDALRSAAAAGEL
ncbi:MAG: DUF1595 domain-containing protein, partial [Myxococcota bacterium]